MNRYWRSARPEHAFSPHSSTRDECCDYAVVRVLRQEGHDVLAVCEYQESSVDHYLLQLALAESRILLTEDKDFGWLVFAAV